MIAFALYILSTLMLDKSAISLWHSTYELHTTYVANVARILM